MIVAHQSNALIIFILWLVIFLIAGLPVLILFAMKRMKFLE